MVKTVMSSDASEPEESDTPLTKAKEKLIIQQSLIDSSARTLKRLKESTSRLISTSSSSNINGLTNGERESAIDDDIKLQEVSSVTEMHSNYSACNSAGAGITGTP